MKLVKYIILLWNGIYDSLNCINILININKYNYYKYYINNIIFNLLILYPVGNSIDLYINKYLKDKLNYKWIIQLIVIFLWYIPILLLSNIYNKYLLNNIIHNDKLITQNLKYSKYIVNTIYQECVIICFSIQALIISIIINNLPINSKLLNAIFSSFIYIYFIIYELYIQKKVSFKMTIIIFENNFIYLFGYSILFIIIKYNNNIYNTHIFNNMLLPIYTINFFYKYKNILKYDNSKKTNLLFYIPVLTTNFFLKLIVSWLKHH